MDLRRVSDRRPPGLTAAALVACLSVGCGAKTGLRVPDAAVVGDAGDDAFVRFETCVAGRFGLARREARMVFVIDRSGSMSELLGSADGPTRWVALLAALGQTLPRFTSSMQMGALIFPRVPMTGAFAAAQACDQLPGAGLDVDLGLNNATTLLNAVGTSPPMGATPTAAAIGRATRYLMAREARGLAQYLVLATDGAPNCNPTLNPDTCACPVSGSCTAAGLGARNCLDDLNAVSSIDGARQQGVYTYVIGIDGDLDGRYVDVLDRMAVAGGRPRTGARRYYSIQQGDQLQAAFEDIQRTVVRCAYVTPSRPDDPDRIVVRAGAADIPRDPARRDGWDWTDSGYGELTLFGPACDRVLAGSLALEATVICGR